jgi:hypothetical protein
MLHRSSDPTRLRLGVTVSRAGRAAAFEAHHREAADALAMAKQIAAVEGGDLMVLMAAGRGVGFEFVPAARVASYVLPSPPPPIDHGEKMNLHHES